MAIGGGFAVTDRRYALASKKVHKTIDVKDKDKIVAAVSPAASTD
jgi:hypothetical protein